MSDVSGRPRSWEGLAEGATDAPTDAPVRLTEPSTVPPPLTPDPATRTVYDADPNAGYPAEAADERQLLLPAPSGLHEAGAVPPAAEPDLLAPPPEDPFGTPPPEDPFSTPPPADTPPRHSSPASEAVLTPAPGPVTAVGGLAVWKEELIAWCKTLVSAAVYATLIVTFGFQVARVEGYSMSPTLEDQDRLIVNKLAYRLGSPRRNDIVMLYYPKDPDKSFVKRVIAEEGDTVKIEDGRVFVNDVPMADDFVPPDSRGHDDWPPRVVEDGYYFVMGDNRINSSDSRHWGEVPKKYILGRVQLRWWPIPSARLF